MDEVGSGGVSYGNTRDGVVNNNEYSQLPLRRRRRHDPTISNKRVSPLWAHFKDDGKRASCLYCDSKLVHHSSTTPLKNHLIAKHPDKLPVNMQLQTRVRLKSTKETFERDLVKMFIKDLKSLNEVNESLVGFLLPSWSTSEEFVKQNLRSQLEDLYNCYDLKLKKLVEEECVGLTLAVEIWRSQKYNYHHYMCVAGHFLTSLFKSVVLVLGVVYLSELSEEGVALQIKQILRVYNLTRYHVAAMVTPRGFVEWKGVSSILNVPHCECLTSVLHNILQAVLFPYSDFLVRVRQFVSGLRCNLATWKQLLALSLSRNGNFFSLSLDHPERLLSTHDMLLQMFTWQNFLEPMSSFSGEDWNLCHQLVNFLSSFKELSIELNSEKYLNASSTTTTLFGWIRSLRQLEGAGEVQKLRELTIERLQELRPMTFDSPYILATILDPRWKHLPFWPPEHVEKAKEELKKCMGSLSLVKFDKQGELENELMAYFSELRLDPEANPLEWWVEKQSKYPNVALLARRFLAIPDSATSSLEISKRRSLLGPKSIVYLYTLNRNMDMIDANFPLQRKSAQFDYNCHHTNSPHEK